MFRGLSNVGRRISAWRWHHRAVGGPSMFDDHLLRDIGIHRTTLLIPFPERENERRRAR